MRTQKAQARNICLRRQTLETKQMSIRFDFSKRLVGKKKGAPLTVTRSRFCKRNRSEELRSAKKRPRSLRRDTIAKRERHAPANTAIFECHVESSFGELEKNRRPAATIWGKQSIGLPLTRESRTIEPRIRLVRRRSEFFLRDRLKTEMRGSTSASSDKFSRSRSP